MSRPTFCLGKASASVVPCFVALTAILSPFFTAQASAGAPVAQENGRTTRQEAVEPGVNTYTSPTYHWSIEYPEGWTVTVNDVGNVRFEFPFPFALVGVDTICSPEVARVTDLAAFVDQWDARRMPFLTEGGLTFSIVSNVPTTLSSGVAARDVLAELGPGGKSRRIVTIVEDCFYSVDAEMYEFLWPVWEPEFDRMITSFTPPNPAVATLSQITRELRQLALLAQLARGLAQVRVEATPADEAPAKPDAVVTAFAAPAAGDILFADAFDDEAAGRLSRQSTNLEQWTIGYSDSAYVIRKRDPRATGSYFVIAPGTYDNAAISVDVRFVGSPSDPVAHLDCRRSGSPLSSYRLSFDGQTGRLRLRRQDAGQFTVLIDWREASGINPLTEVNRVEFSCSGDVISYSVNGVEVGSVRDSQHARGTSAIGASMNAPVGGVTPETRFDNLVITQG